MIIQIKKNEPELLVLLIKGIDTALASALRRTIIAEIPTIAIEKVTFYNNTTVLHDEFIAHRLGLLPLSMPDIVPEKVTFTFDNTAKDDETWTSNMLITDNENVKCVFGEIPLVKVVKGHQLSFTAEAIIGTGSQHSKWSPVCTCFFKMTDEGFLFTVETVGTMKPARIVREAIKLLRKKLEIAEKLSI